MSTHVTGERPDRLEEACAVFGVYAPGEDVARLTCFGLQALQHRGQESAGIAVGDGETVLIHKDLGLVNQVFNEEALVHLKGDIAIGHTRYSTAGGGDWAAAQPHVSAIDDELIAVAHNGTLVDTIPQRARLVGEGVQLHGYTDSEVAACTIGVDTRRTGHIRSGIQLMMQQLHGAYAIVLVTPVALYAFRDPNGIRPLSLGALPGGRGWVVASETCGLDAVGAEFVRDVEPGEILKVSAAGLESTQGAPAGQRASCIFEYVYFARPDSVLDGEVVYHARRRMGRILAREAPADADAAAENTEAEAPADADAAIPSDAEVIAEQYTASDLPVEGEYTLFAVRNQGYTVSAQEMDASATMILKEGGSGKYLIDRGNKEELEIDRVVVRFHRKHGERSGTRRHRGAGHLRNGRYAPDLRAGGSRYLFLHAPHGRRSSGTDSSR